MVKQNARFTVKFLSVIVGIMLAMGFMSTPVFADEPAEELGDMVAGSLWIRLAITVDGEPTTSTQFDGSYLFHVSNASGQNVKDVTVEVTNGAGEASEGNLGTGTFTVTEDMANFPIGMTASPISQTLDIEGIDLYNLVEFTNNYDTQAGKAKIQVAVKKDGVAQSGLADSLYLKAADGSRPEATFTYSEETGTYVFDPAVTHQYLPLGEYDLYFEVAPLPGSPGYPVASEHIIYADEYAISTTFNYSTVTLAKDPAYEDALDIVMEVVSGANSNPWPDEYEVCALDGAKLKIATTPHAGYHFDGYSVYGTAPTWDPSKAEQTITVNGTADIMAHADVNAYTVKFVNYDGTVLQSSTVAFGEMPKYAGETPARPADEQYSYLFRGWKPAVTAVSGDAVYTADYATVPDGETISMYRLYNPYSGEHFYTAHVDERDLLISEGWVYEGIGWTAPTEGEEVHRLYNPYGGEHHYTMNAQERDGLVDVGWTYEGVGWWCPDPSEAVPIYREYNPNEFACNHNYTANREEHDGLVALGWVDEGTAWFGVSPH